MKDKIKKKAAANGIARLKKAEPVAKKLAKRGIVGAYSRINVDLIDPNPWNPNKVAPAMMKKLRKGIEEMLRKHGAIPPVIVRPHPDNPDRYQVVDGAHRLLIVSGKSKTIEQNKCDPRLADEIDAFVIDVPEDLAKRLTLNLNYMRGDPEEEAEAYVLKDLIKGGWSPEELSETLYLDDETIMDRITAYGDNDALRAVLEQQDKEKDEKGDDSKEIEDDDVWMEVTFNVSGAQAKVIEAEIGRICKKLKGKNARGRALEFMAVQSAQSDLPDDMV